MMSGFTTACATGQLQRIELLLTSPNTYFHPEEISRGLVSACREGHVPVVARLLRLPAVGDRSVPSTYRGFLRHSINYAVPCEGTGGTGTGTGTDTGTVSGTTPLGSSAGPDEAVEGVTAAPPAVETVLGAACQGGREEVVRMLLREPGIEAGVGTPLCFACQGGHLIIVNMLLEKLLDSISTDEIGRSLVVACKSGFYGIVVALMGLKPPHMKVNLLSTMVAGETPLCTACGAGVLDVVNLLLEEMGSNPVYTRDISEAFVIACKGGYVDIVNKFLSLPRNMRPSLIHTSKLDRTALSAACEAGHRAIVDLLLREDFDVNLGNPLWYASMNNHLEIVRSLLRNPTITVNKMLENKTPLVVAILHNQIDKDFLVARVLISHSGLIPPHCQEAVVRKLRGHKKFCELLQLATSIELANLLLDRQHPNFQPEIRNTGRESDREEILELKKKNADLEARITRIQEERASDLAESKLNQQISYEIQNYTDHVLAHVSGGSWCNVLPDGSCKKGQIKIWFEESPSFDEIVCYSCPLDMAAKIIVTRKFGFDTKELVVTAVGADNSSEELLTDTNRTLTDLQQGSSGADKVTQIKVRITSLVRFQESDLKVVSTLGVGSYGTVFKCLHIPTNTYVAVKALHEAIRSEFNNTRFWEEFAIHSRMRHPNIVRCLGTCVTITGGPWIVSELMEMNLRQLLQRRSLSFQEVIALSLGICRGVAALHKRNIIHRDLSSNNVLLDSHGIPKITDFGVSRVIRSVLVSTFSIAGTPIYVAPQMHTRHYGIQGDMWEIAVLLSEMLNGTITVGHPGSAEQITNFMRELRDSLSPLDFAEVNRLCKETEGGNIPIAECLIRRNTMLEALKCEPKFANIHPTCVRCFCLVVESCLSILESNRPSSRAIEKEIMTCAQLAFGSWSDDDDHVESCVSHCLAAMVASSFPPSSHYGTTTLSSS
ncbi:kinase domain protein [Pelomyxa schiedti]|nr:kinase domain protein [Pelomyxa schiedti]